MTPENLREHYAISIADAAEHLSFSEATVYRLIRSNQLYTFKFGRKQFITRSSLDALIIKRWPDNYNPEFTARLIGRIYEKLAAEQKGENRNVSSDFRTLAEPLSEAKGSRKAKP